MDLKQKKERIISESDIIKMIFFDYDEQTEKLEPYGSMLWSGSYWDIDVDTENDTIKNFFSSGLLENRILTQDDYELYIPYVNLQSKQLVVKGITKKFYDENLENFKNNPLFLG